MAMRGKKLWTGICALLLLGLLAIEAKRLARRQT